MVTGTLTATVTTSEQRAALTGALAAAQQPTSDAGAVSGQVSNDGSIASVHVLPSGDLSSTDRAMVLAEVPAPGETPSAQATGALNQAPPSEAQPDTPTILPAVVPAKSSGKRGKVRERQAQATRPAGIMRLEHFPPDLGRYPYPAWRK